MLRIDKTVLAALLSHARSAFPLEACGYLAGKGDRIVCHYSMRNVLASEVVYAMDPAEQFNAVRDMRGRGLDLVGVYHSHPATPARPSARDILLAFDPNLSYWIVSLAEGVETVRAFRIRGGTVAREDLVVE